MKVGEILEMIDTMVQNNVIPQTKVTWMNLIQNEYFRDYPVPDTIYSFLTEPGQEFYEMPEDCAEDRITRVTINDKSYPYTPLSGDEELSHFWTTISEIIMIHPEPSEVYQSFIYYRPRPRQLSVDRLDQTPDFPSDYIEMLVFGVAARVARTSAETEKLSPVFQSDFQALAEKARRDLTKPKQRHVNMVRGW